METKEKDGEPQRQSGEESGASAATGREGAGGGGGADSGQGAGGTRTGKSGERDSAVSRR